MVLYPETVKKAQAEIDRVIGLERLPILEERADLPYIDCILKEVFRYVSSHRRGKISDVYIP